MYSTSQKEAKEEAGVAQGDGVAVRQEDVVDHEAGVAVAEALEVIVVAEALGAGEAQEGSAVEEGSVVEEGLVVVAVEEDLGEVVVVSEAHEIVFVYVEHVVWWGRTLAISRGGSSSFTLQSLTALFTRYGHG